MNNVCIMGRLTRDAELRATQTGKSVASFTIAVDSGYGEKKTANFIPCVAWEKTAEFISKYFGKGDMIAITGELRSRSYEKDGQKRTVVEILVSNVDFCGGKKESSSAPKFVEIEDDGELPF